MFLVQLSARFNKHELAFPIYDGAPAHSNAASPREFIHQIKLPPYSPFDNIVEQAISALKAAIKRDISRPEVQVEMGNRNGPMKRGIPLGEFRQHLLLEASYGNVGRHGIGSCRHTFHDA